MLLNHIGITNRSVEDAIGFYRNFLGFEILKESVVPAELSEQLFHASRDVHLIVFERDGIKIEVFISPEYSPPFSDYNHVGLYLDNFEEIAGKAPRSGVDLIVGKTAEKTVYFLKDFSGNLVEIKQK